MRRGHYTRLLTALGAVSVVGVDISQRMIDLAMAAESAKPMGIDYRVGDACSLDFDSKFDLVTAAYLLNYARNRNELLNMCRSIARCLKPGGRFVTVNNNPAQQVAQFAATQKYRVRQVGGRYDLGRHGNPLPLLPRRGNVRNRELPSGDRNARLGPA